jgi:CubicO group peptidase (beta-lactamase class C family)
MEALDVVASWPSPASAVAVLGPEGVRGSTGPTDEVQPWASVTKLVTALAVLVEVERGSVDLDDPAGPPGSTVRHLLAHTSGLGPAGDPILAAPGRRRIYSNRGFEVLAEVVTDRTGRPFADLVQTSVLGPLGMTRSRLDGSPAHGINGPLDDLARLGVELLAPTLVPKLMQEATSTVFPGVSGILPGFGKQDPNDWGLGFEIRDGKSPHWTGSRNSPATFGHFGQSGSFLWVDPEAGLACACLTGLQFGKWAGEAWPVLSDRVLAEAGR